MNARPSIANVTQIVNEAEAASHAQDEADVRGAAALNYLDICIRQSRRAVKTNADFRALRILLGTGDEVVKLDKDAAVVPAGFWPAPPPARSSVLDSIAASLVAAVEEGIAAPAKDD